MKNINIMMKVLFIGLSVIFFMQACGGKSEKEDKKMKTRTDERRIANVHALKLSKKLFSSEIVSNGTLNAERRASLKFQSSSKIEKIFVRNGEYMEKGEKIAMLEQFKLKNSFDNAKNNLKKARLELQNVLIGQGYTINDSLNIPAGVMSMAKIKSGYDNSLNNYSLAEYEYKASVLYAPFDGVVGDIVSKEDNYPESGKPFCTVIDNKGFDVVFMILENELYGVAKGDAVKVFPYAVEDYEVDGKIREINPIVDVNGMVRVVAHVKNKDGKLFDGMNVSVKVECKPRKMLIIPKSALVLRSNRKVVFTLKNGLAQWNYVEVGEENSDSYVVLKGLNAGDSVIYNGNMNLAHETPVKVLE